MLEVLATTQAAFRDRTSGLAARAAAIADTADLAVRSDFAFGKWALRETLSPTTAHRVVIRPAAGLEEAKQGTLQRDAVHTLAILIEVFGADEDEIERSLVVIQLAVIQVLDELRDYSDAHDGTVIEIPDAISTRYGEFTGSASLSGGLISTVNIRERSTL